MKVRKGQMMVTSESKMARKQHTAPCADCPWARKSIPGWLGPHDAETWVRIAHSDLRVDCHTRKDAAGEQWQCAGMAIYRANVCKRSEFSLPQNKTLVFTWKEFEAHHGSEK